MKTFFKQSLSVAMIIIVTLFAFKTYAGNPADNPQAQLSLKISLPQSWQSVVEKQDFGNEVLFNFKNGNAKPVFLFSITKVSGDQWIALQGQVRGATILENKDGYITFLQMTNQSKIKGADNDLFQQVVEQLNAVISSIQINS